MASIPVGAPAPVAPAAGRLSTVRLDVSVELGRAKIPVEGLLALDEGGVIRLGRPVGGRSSWSSTEPSPLAEGSSSTGDSVSG